MHEYVGTIVGESTTTEFRLALAHEAVREQDIIAVDVELQSGDRVEGARPVRVWAKVQRIERLNPLFPSEAGHELAATRTDPLDTVLSLSREMVTAVCRVLGAEDAESTTPGKLASLRYPPRPASGAYRPSADDLKRIVIGDLDDARKKRALDVAFMSNRPEVSVLVDGHAIVTRHLAILAMTGAGKSWTARRIIEEIALKNYPIVIFDPHGDYAGLSDVSDLSGRVRHYYAEFPVFEENSEAVAAVVESLSWPLAQTQRERFTDLFEGAKQFHRGPQPEISERVHWLADRLNDERVRTFGNRVAAGKMRPNLLTFASFVQRTGCRMQR